MNNIGLRSIKASVGVIQRSIVLAVTTLAASRAQATLFQNITANNATIDSSGDVVKNDVTYLTVYKARTSKQQRACADNQHQWRLCQQ